MTYLAFSAFNIPIRDILFAISLRAQCWLSVTNSFKSHRLYVHRDEAAGSYQWMEWENHKWW